MKNQQMRNKILTAITILTVSAAVALFIFDQSPLIAIVIGAIACFMIYFMWSPPPKHKDFSDRDRLEATSRAMGGSGAPPELWTPDMPEKKHHKGKK